MTTPPPITIAVPVYDGYDDIRRCLESVARHHGSNQVDAELLVIDDAGPDPRIGELLDAFAEPGAPGTAGMAIRVIRNETNRGFVANANTAFATATGDVVLLNADTVVTDGWLDRLAEAAAAPEVATVTPVTNHGSICTLPRRVIEAFALDGPDPDIDGCAQFVLDNAVGLRPEIITGVGFCMLVTRAALDAAGPFDEVAYGRGYGEEVDFCLRASRLGFRHLVDDTTFVFHRGGVSFGEERAERMHVASTFLHKRFPFFREANRRERAADPLRIPFTALELALDARDPGRPNVLHLLHGPPDDIGGTEKHLGRLLGALQGEFDFTLLYPVESGFVVQTRHRTRTGTVAVHEHLLPGSVRWVDGTDDPVAAEALVTTLELFGADAVHIHSFNGFSLAPLEVLDGLDCPVIAFVHDPFLACPHYSLLHLDREACGIPDDRAVCAGCLPVTEHLDIGHLDTFRATVAAHLDAVDRWVFASRSAADTLTRAYAIDPDRIEIIEHAAPIDRDRPAPVDVSRILDEPLRLAFVGRGWAKKGLTAANALADALAMTPIEVHHFGPLLDDASEHLVTHGTYDNEVLPDLLDRTGIQVVLLPGPTPETYGLVLSEAVIAGLPAIGAHYGALGERIRAGGIGWTIDPTDHDELVELVRRLDRCRPEVLRATRRTASVTFPTPADVARRYGELYRGDAPDARGSRD